MTKDDVDLKSVRPQDYLKDGFLEKDGRLREGINGYCSLATAYHCRDEKVQPDTLKKIVDQLTKLGEDYFNRGGDSPDEPLDASTLSAIERISHSLEVRSSATISALFAAARPWLTDWKNLSALTLHLDRIMAQLALITSSRFEPLLPTQ